MKLSIVCLFLLLLNLISVSTVGYAKPKPLQKISTSNAFVVTIENIQPTIKAFATVHSLQMYPLVSKVSADVIDPNNLFVPGQKIQKNQVIVSLNDDELRYGYYAQKSTLIKLITQLLADFKVQFPQRVGVWESFLESYNIEDPLPKLPQSLPIKEKNYLSVKNIYNTYYSLKQTEVLLEKYQFVAPFDGSVLSPTVAHTDFVQAGKSLGFFIGEGNYKTGIMIPFTQRAKLKVGNKVMLTHQLTGIEVITSIKSISEHIDPESQTITAYIEFESLENCHNLVMDATIFSVPIINVAKIPRKLLRNSQVTVLTTTGPQVKSVTIEHVEGNDAIVSGLTNLDKLISP